MDEPPKNAIHQMRVTKTEKRIIKWFREAKPMEKLEVTKDRDGKPDKGFIRRSQSLQL